MTDWIAFLYGLGRFLASKPPCEGGRPGAVVAVPCLDYASALIASGVVAEQFSDLGLVAGDPGDFKNRVGEAVSFPYQRIGQSCLRRLRGVIEGVEEYMGSKRLEVTFVENEETGREFTRRVERRWLSLIRPLEETPNLRNSAGGSLLAENIDMLEALVGQAGSVRLLEESHRGCCILDTKSRIKAEAKQPVDGDRLGVNDGCGEVFLRDLVRLASEGPEAMAETHCCQVFREAQPGWPVTIIAGALHFLRSWEDCDSDLRVALFSPVENSYRDAVELANYMFERRGAIELDLPGELLSLKPASIDIQLMYSD